MRLPAQVEATQEIGPGGRGLRSIRLEGSSRWRMCKQRVTCVHANGEALALSGSGLWGGLPDDQAPRPSLPQTRMPGEAQREDLPSRQRLKRALVKKQPRGGRGGEGVRPGPKQSTRPHEFPKPNPVLLCGAPPRSSLTRLPPNLHFFCCHSLILPFSTRILSRRILQLCGSAGDARWRIGRAPK